jgi:hypothetical protein
MNDLEKVTLGVLWTAAACLCASPLAAQQEGGDKPKAAAYQYSLLLNTADNQQDTDQTQSVQPDSRPLSGVQNPTIGTPGVRHSYWVPGIQYSNTARSNSLNSTANSGWNTTSFVSTDLSLLEAWGHSTLSANYSGGGYFSTDKVQGNGQYQRLSTNYEIDGRRWQVLLVDEFSYLPESSFGFGGASGLSTPGVAGSLAVPLPGLQTGYVPGQTILTAIGSRYSNSSAVQLTYKESARGSITLAGVFGILRFMNPGNINSDSEMLNAGYDYSITRRDSIGFMYRFGAYRYPGSPQALGDHAMQFEYGRKITGRMALKITGGPEVTTFRVPIGSLTERISGSGGASLIYAFARSNMDLSYTHGVNGGSGVFSGASSDQVGATLSTQLTRVWNGNMNLGYARNRQILSASGSPAFTTWVVGAGLSRSLGHVAHFSLGYEAQIQGASAAAAGSNYTAHQVVMSFQWHTRPFVLR